MRGVAESWLAGWCRLGRIGVVGKARAALAAVGLVAAVALGTSGCTEPRVCAGPMIPTPAAYVDATPWLAAHATGTVTACDGRQCATINTATPRRMGGPEL